MEIAVPQRRSRNCDETLVSEVFAAELEVFRMRLSVREPMGSHV